MSLLSSINKEARKYNIRMLNVILLLSVLLDVVNGQMEVTFDVYDSTGAVNPYFLILLFWLVVLLWPICRWIYSTFIERAVNSVKQRVENIAHQISERMSAAGRKLSEQMKNG